TTLFRSVVTGQNDDAIFLAREFDDVVGHRLKAGRCAGGKGVGFEVALGGFGSEVLLDELLGFEMAGRAVESFRRYFEKLRGEVVGGLPVKGAGAAKPRRAF